MSRYKQRFDGVGFSIPNLTPYKLACCDCGLIHVISIAAPNTPKGTPIGFAAKRDNRATAARRRKKK